MRCIFQIIDIIGYRLYKEVFLLPLDVIKNSDLDQCSKERYYRLYVHQLVHYLGGSLFPEESSAEDDAIWAGLDFEVAWVGTDFRGEGVYFSEIFRSALERALEIFHRILIMYRIGTMTDKGFITDYYLRRIDIMTGSMCLFNTRRE